MPARPVIPQVIDRRGAAAERSFEEQMWLPFQKFDDKAGAEGLALGYVAYDDVGFYFAAKIADTTPHPGAPRFSLRDKHGFGGDTDAYYYPEVATFVDPKTKERTELRWPDGVRRFSYRTQPALPSGFSARPYDNVLIAFNAIAAGADGWLLNLPGRPEKLVAYKTTDYQYALNTVAPSFGGGVEVWRLDTPGMPRKAFYPRQPRHPLEGAVEGAKLVNKHEGGTRVVEAMIPWSEIPHVRELMQRGQPLKFSFRVNHDTKAPAMELGIERSACEGSSRAFSPDWSRSWPNELEFGWEPAQ